MYLEKEKEMLEQVQAAKTIADFARIGFNKLNIQWKDGKETSVNAECLAGSDIVCIKDNAEGKVYLIDGLTPVKFFNFTLDFEGHRVARIKEMEN